MKFKCFLLITALISSSQSTAMLKRNSFSKNKHKYTLIDHQEKKLTKSELKRYKNNTELEEAALLQVIIHEDKRCTQKIMRTSSSKIKFVT